LNEHLFNNPALKKTDYEKFIPIFFKKKKSDKIKTHKQTNSKKEVLEFSNIMKQTFIKLADIQGENLLKINFHNQY
jgi:hypothetical protein